MAQLTKEQANRKIRNKEIYYEVIRNGSRTTKFYFSDLKSALAKYDAICKGNRQNLSSVYLMRWNNPKSEYAGEWIYTTSKRSSNPYRDVGADRY